MFLSVDIIKKNSGIVYYEKQNKMVESFSGHVLGGSWLDKYDKEWLGFLKRVAECEDFLPCLEL
jgi:hypothetical protein